MISEDSSRHGRRRTAWAAASTADAHRGQHARAWRGARSGVGATSSKNESSEGDERQAGEREQHQAVHRDAAEHREDAVPDRGEGSDHTNNSAVLRGDHSTRPSVVIRTHCTPHSWASSGPPSKNRAVAIASARIAVGGDRPGRRDRAHRLSGARIEHVVQALAPRAAVRRRGAERGIRHLDDADRAPRVVRMLQRDALRGAAHREVAARVDDDVAAGARRTTTSSTRSTRRPLPSAPTSMSAGSARRRRPPVQVSTLAASRRAPGARRGRRTRRPRRTRAPRATRRRAG